MTSAKRVGGLQKFVECVLTTAKRVGGMNEEIWKMRFKLRKACRRLADVRRVLLTTPKRVVSLQGFGNCVCTM